MADYSKSNSKRKVVAIQSDYSLKNFNTMHLECLAKFYFKLEMLDELPGLRNYIVQKACPYFVLGGGSNILLPEQYDGLVIHNNLFGVGELKILEEEYTLDEACVLVRAMAGEIWDSFVAFTLENSWYGLENLSLIPGTVGATPIQNIGAYGVEVKDFIEYVECFDLNSGESISISNKDCNFSYRNSRFKHELNLLVTAVVFKLKKSPKLEISYGDIATKMAQIINPTPLDLRNCIIETRKSKLPDPGTIPNVGSFFHNPILINAEVKKLKLNYPNLPVYKFDEQHSKISAGWLIDHAGFKGYKHKNVGVYDKQALVLVNYTARVRDEVLELATIIQEAVLANYGVILNIEPIQV